VDREVIIRSRTPDFYETVRDPEGSFAGFVSKAPLGTDDLMYTEEPVQEATVWLEPGRAYLYSELTPEQQSIYDQGHRQGREDGLILAQAIAGEVKEGFETDLEEDFHNFVVIADTHNALVDVVEEGFELVGEGLAGLLSIVGRLEGRVADLEDEVGHAFG
jgi:hypothetical protein